MRVADALASLGIGYLTDRLETPIGRCRPLILLCALPLAGLSILMHTVPSRVPYVCLLLIGKPLRISIFACVVAALLSVFYAAGNVPYLALLAATSDSVERKMRTAAIRSLFAMTASVCVHFFTLRLITCLGRGSVAIGWNRTATIYAIIANAVLLLCGLFSRESPGSVASSRWKKEEVLLLLRSALWRRLSLAMFFVLAAHSARSGVMLY